MTLKESPKNTSNSVEPTSNSESSLTPDELEEGNSELNINQLRLMLSDIIRGLRAGTVTPVAANAYANVAGKVLNSYKLQMEYAKALGRTPDIGGLMPAQPEHGSPS